MPLVAALVAVAAALLAGYLHAADSGDNRLLLPVLSAAATVAAMVVVVGVLGRRAGTGAISHRRCRGILAWGLLSGMAGFLFSFGLELCLPRVLETSGYGRGWSVLAGPVEEPGKLIIPVALRMRGRFRLPREGYLLVLTSAATFGVMESGYYGFHPEDWRTVRPLIEVLHPLLTGFVAAVLWPIAWERRRFLTVDALDALVVVAGLHSLNNAVAFGRGADGPPGAITTVAIVAMTLAQWRATGPGWRVPVRVLLPGSRPFSRRLARR